MDNQEGYVNKPFTLIVVNYGSSRLLQQNLSQLSLAVIEGNILVVDNYTSESERHALRTLGAAQEWTILEMDANVGFGCGVNKAANFAFSSGSESIAVLNPDAHITLPDLEKLVRVSQTDQKTMVAPTIKSSNGDVWFDGMDLYAQSGRVASRRRKNRPEGPKEPWISGACFAISKLMWELVGGFDGDYFLYWEDVDISRRVAACGGNLLVLQDVLAIHDEGGTQLKTGSSETKSEIYYFYNIRNRLIYAGKFLGARELRHWIWLTPIVSFEILATGGRRQFLSSWIPYRAYFRGIFYGLMALKTIRRKRSLG